MINLLVILLLLATGVGVWAHHSKLSALARRYAQAFLEEQGLQLLDQSIILESVRLSRYRGMPCLRRKFRFEFSRRGDRRYYGWITLNAWAKEHTELQPFTDDSLN